MWGRRESRPVLEIAERVGALAEEQRRMANEIARLRSDIAPLLEWRREMIDRLIRRETLIIGL